jgi:LPXTG-site transpeptidase (sortase) family protein
MPERQHIGLDNPTFNGRLRSYGHAMRPVHRRPVVAPTPRYISDIRLPSEPAQSPAPVTVPAPKPSIAEPHPITRHRSSAKPALPRQSRSKVLTRHAVTKKPRRRLPHVTAKARMSVILMTMAIAVFVSGTYVSILTWRSNRTVKAQVAGAVSQASSDDGNDSDIPDETDITTDSINNYKVAGDLPRLLRIPKIGVLARVKRLGVNANNELKTPANVFDTGWYDGSAKPGESGAILIDGHVSGPNKYGIFYRLGNLQVGDKIQIERGDGTQFSYHVVKTQAYDYDKVDMAAAMRSVEPGKPGLNLITCSGRYDVRNNRFEQRLMVFAVQD